MNRRTLCLAMPATLLPLGCAPGTATPSTITTIPGGVTISPATMAQIQAELAILQTDAAQVGSLATPNATLVQSVSGAVTLIASLATPFFPAAPAVAVA